MYISNNSTNQNLKNVFVLYPFIDGEFVASPVMDIAGLFAVNPETDAKYEGYFTMIFADDYVKKYGAQFDNFKISVIR